MTPAVGQSVAGRGTEEIAAALEEARARTLALVDLPAEVQCAQVSRLMSPMVWDLAHIANYEELWLLRSLDGRAPVDPALDDLYDAFEHPRWERPALPILGPDEARRYAATIRAEVLALLDRPSAADDHRRRRLLHEGFVYGMVVQHEHQHCETLLATRQLLGDAAPSVPGTTPAPRSSGAPAGDTDLVTLPGGEVVLGTDDEPWAYDNERPAHAVVVEPFRLARDPVTVAGYREFVAAGGYRDDTWWSPAGWAWRCAEGLTRPQFWSDDLERVLRFGQWRDLDALEPVQHVCFHEASAYARWSGLRLPTEAEWEVAATIAADGTKRRYPWGDDAPTPDRANLGQRHDGPAPVGTYPAGANPWGVRGLVGDVWEWTTSAFAPYPGFAAFPYREYSEVFFGAGTGDDGYRVLRGGSWAAHPTAVRGTFRNWDHPVRRQIFCGVRLAGDVA